MKNKTINIFVLLYFTVFVISNSILVSNNNDIELDSTSLSYWLRHLVVILVSFYSVFIFYKKISFVLFNLIVFTTLYLICQQYILGLMTIALFISSIVFGSGYEKILKSKKLLLILLLISLVPLMFNFNDIANYGLFSTKYGRDRLLLGYFHPKEAAQPFTVLLVLLYISSEKYRGKIIFFGALLLYFIGSRNCLLYFLIFIFLTYTSAYKVFLPLLLFIFLIFFVYLNYDSLKNIIDEFSSNRISSWATVMKHNGNGNSQLRADSFYIEIFVKGGILALALFIFWLLYFTTVNNIFAGFYSAIPIGTALICSQLVFSMLDSGITSTGSLIHIFSWSMYYKFSKKIIK